MAIAALAVLLASVIGQAVGATQGSTGLSIFAAGAFLGAILRLSWQINSPWWHTAQSIGPPAGSAQPVMASRNASLLALGYSWAAASMLAVYLLTPLRWQHGWQYGLGMALIAALIYGAGQRIPGHWTPQSSRRLIGMSLLHGWAASAGLFWLIYTGKMLSPKADWAANVVFVTGAIAIAGLSAIAIRTARLLAGQASTAAADHSPLA
jgi:hypothetical protein